MKNKNTFYTNQISNPYCSNGNFMFKHNSDKTLGGKISKAAIKRNRPWKEKVMKPISDKELKEASNSQETL